MNYDKQTKSTCSPESSGGPLPCSLRAGETDLFGREVAHVNRSARRASAKAPPTSGTCGPTCCDSSPSASPSASSASKLVPIKPWHGGTRWLATWKRLVTPAGRTVWTLDASATNTNGSVFIGVPTPLASDNRNRGSIGKTPSVSRRKQIGKQIGLSMLFDGRPCPFCVLGLMGYGPEWAKCASTGLEMLLYPKSQRRS